MSVQSDGSVVITLADVYAAVRRLEDKVTPVTDHGEQLADHEVRMRSLERYRYAVPSSLLLALSSLITTLITSWTGKH